MDLIRALIALHPRGWRERYGDEFAAMLEDTPLTPSVLADVCFLAAGLRIRAHLGVVTVAAAPLASALAEIVAYRAGLTANILWAPDSGPRALALVAVAGPWAAVLARVMVRRRSRSHA